MSTHFHVPTSNRVGGVVSETSFKFFIQFLFYALLFAVYNLIVMAVCAAELRRHVSLAHRVTHETLRTFANASCYAGQRRCSLYYNPGRVSLRQLLIPTNRIINIF